MTRQDALEAKQGGTAVEFRRVPFVFALGGECGMGNGGGMAKKRDLGLMGCFGGFWSGRWRLEETQQKNSAATRNKV